MQKQTVPAETKQIPATHQFLLVIANTGLWARQKCSYTSEEKAVLKSLRKDTGWPTEFVVKRVTQDTAVDGMGGLTYPRELPPINIGHYTVRNGKLFDQATGKAVR